MPDPNAPAGSSVPKKKRSGCVIALFIVLGVVAFTFIVGAIVLWRFSVSPTGQKAMRVVGDTAKIIYNARNAPGTDAVRKAGNCDQAFVVGGDEIAEIAHDLTDAGGRHAPTLVSCQVGFFWEPPTCELLAKAYVDAVHPNERFVVDVKKTGARDDACRETFEPDGSAVEEP